MPEMFITQTRSENKIQPDAIMIVICSVLWSGDFVIVTTLVDIFYYFLQFLPLFLHPSNRLIGCIWNITRCNFSVLPKKDISKCYLFTIYCV